MSCLVMLSNVFATSFGYMVCFFYLSYRFIPRMYLLEILVFPHHSYSPSIVVYRTCFFLDNHRNPT